MERARKPIAIAFGTALVGGLGLIGFKLAGAAGKREVAIQDQAGDPITVIAARQVS